MLALVLVGALIAQAAHGKPTNCGELCEGSSTGHQAKSSYSSYSKQSSYGQQRHYSSGGNGGLGVTGGRLENLDENVITGLGGGASSLDRPGTWHDSKHYVTDDGKGEMSYRAGQTVSNNGFSKFAEHSYSYGTHDSHAPLSNSQILSTAEFNRELQGMRSRISSFMGNFHLGAGGSLVNSHFLEDFKNKASLISGQLNDVCSQTDVGSSMYQQMQQMMQQFQRDVEQRQREIETMIFQSSSTSSTSSSSSTGAISHGSLVQAPQYQRPASTNYYPASVQQYPVQPTFDETLLQHQVEEQLTSVQSLISSFYSSFNRPNTNLEYQQNLNGQVAIINQKLTDLSYESVQSESTRARIDNLKSNFERHVSSIRARIEEAEQRNREEETRRQERLRQLDEDRQRLEREDAERQREDEERQRQAREEEERQRVQREEIERVRIQRLETERILRVQREEEERLEAQREENARKLREEARQRQEHEDEARQRKQRLENDRLRIEAESQRLQREKNERLVFQQQQDQQRPAMQVAGGHSVQVSGSSQYEHTIKGSYGSQVHGGSGAGPTGGAYTRPQQVVLQPHVDLTAAMSRLQQDLNRLQNEVNNFNMYTMRLTSANSATVVSEAERQADLLRQSLKNLCDTSGRYQNQNVQSGAEELKRRFEEMFRAFESQAANYNSSSGANSGFSASGGYSSSSSYGVKGRYGTAHAPTITNAEFEHSKSMEIEVGQGPAAQRYSSGYSASGAFGSQADGQSAGQRVECPEMYAGQPCSDQLRRHRRDVGDQYGPFFDPIEALPDFAQEHLQIFDDFPQHPRSQQFGRYSSQLEGYSQQHINPSFDVLPYGPQLGNFGIPQSSLEDDFSQRTRQIELPRDHQPIRHIEFGQPIREAAKPQSRNLQQQNHRVEDLTRRQSDFDDYYRRQSPPDQIYRPLAVGSSEWEREIEDLSQQHVNYGQNEELDSLQKPRSEDVDILHHAGDKIRAPSSGSLEKSGLDRSDQFETLSTTEEPQRVQPITTFGKSESEKEHGNPQRVRQTIVKFGSSKFTLDESGFNDELKPREKKPESIDKTNPIKPIGLVLVDEQKHGEQPKLTYGKSRTEDETAKPKQLPPTTTFGKFESDDFTLQKSGFNDYPEHIGKIELTESPQRIKPITTFGKSGSVQESEDFTLQKSVFGDYPSENTKLELDDKPERVRPLVPGNLELSQQTEDLTQQQNNFASSLTRNQKLEKSENFGVSDLTQQTASQVDFGPDSQVGRSFSSQDISKPGRYSSHNNNSQQNTLAAQNLELGQRNDHPTGQYIENLSQQHQQSFDNIRGLDSTQSNRYLQSANSQTERSFTSTENQGSISTIRPTVRPAPKPVPRYTRPWQVSQIHNVPKQPENEQNPTENEYASIGKSTTPQSLDHHANLDKHSKPLRGDLPGNSEPSTTPSTYENIPVISEKPNTNPDQKLYVDYDSRQQYEQVDLHENDESDDLQKPRNEWQQNNSGQNQFSQSGGAYNFNHQQSIHHNYSYSQNSNYYNQQNSGIELGQTIQNPLNQHNSHVQLEHQSKPTEYGQEQQSMYQFHEHQASNSKFEIQASSNYNLKPGQFEPDHLSESARQNAFGQQTQEPLFEQSSQLEFGQQKSKISSLEQQTSQKSEDIFAAGVIPLDETRSINTWSETEPINTTPRTFWKRMGQKLSHSIDKAKERAKTIFG